MVPAIGTRAIGLNARVLDGYTTPDIILHHGDSVQSSDILSLSGSLSLFYDVGVSVHEA